jgi:hypothetical protein
MEVFARPDIERRLIYVIRGNSLPSPVADMWQICGRNFETFHLGKSRF